MADWRDVMTARADADYALEVSDRHVELIRDRVGNETVAIANSARALALEIRALGVLIDHARGDAR